MEFCISTSKGMYRVTLCVCGMQIWTWVPIQSGIGSRSLGFETLHLAKGHLRDTAGSGMQIPSSKFPQMEGGVVYREGKEAGWAKGIETCTHLSQYIITCAHVSPSNACSSSHSSCGCMYASTCERIPSATWRMHAQLKDIPGELVDDEPRAWQLKTR